MADVPASQDRSLQYLADHAPIMIWISGLDAGCFYFNRAWLAFRGRTLEQEQGNGWAEGVHPDDLAVCVAHYRGCFVQRVPFAMNYRLKKANGEYRWVLDRGAPHFSISGEFLGFFGGCAESGNQSPAVLNAGLHVSLREVAEYARELAQARLKAAAAAAGGSSSPFVALAAAAAGHPVPASRDLRHAAGQMETLATDLLKYREIPPGTQV